MRAAIYNGPRDYQIEDIDDPIARDDGLVVKVRAAGICGGDLHAYKDRHLERPPGRLVYGHENAGEVVEVGRNVEGIEVGDRVFAEAFGFCFDCDACRQGNYMQCTTGLRVAGLLAQHGGFAEYLSVPVVMRHPKSGAPTNIFKLPENMSFGEGALVEPVNIGVGVTQGLQLRGDETVLVVGAGMVGLGTVMCLRSTGVARIMCSDVSDMRLGVAAELGADVVLNSASDDVVARVREETGGRGADIVIEAAGVAESFDQALGSVCRGGRLSVVAYFEKPVTFEPHQLINRGVRMLPGGGGNFHDAFVLLAAGGVKGDRVITHTFPLDQINEAHETAIDTRKSIKVMIDPWSS